MTKAKTLCDSILSFLHRPTDQVALMVPRKKGWVEYSWKDYYQQIHGAAYSLLRMNVTAADRVAIMSQTQHEWSVCDLATLAIKGIVVPIYPNSTTEEFKYIINDSQPKVLFLENKSNLKSWLLIKEHCPSVRYVVCFEKGREQSVDMMSFNQFLDYGHIHDKHLETTFHELCSNIDPTDVATIIYTSGTTGKPKGVVLTHAQVMSEVSETFSAIGITAKDRSLSFLPYSHILGRVEHWGHTYVGFTMAYAESIERIKNNLPEVKPTVLVAVPRIFEKIYGAILAQAETNPVSHNLFKWAIAVGQRVSQCQQQRKGLSLSLFAEYQLAKKAVLDRVVEAFGGKLRFAVSGGAPLSAEVAQFFHAAGVLILEGYGLSETTAAIAANRPYDFEFGTVGKPIGDVEFKIAEDGEILVKSEKVMREYYKDTASTQAVLKDGWFATGDIGEILPSGRLRITDRKKDLIKTAGGKYVAPQRLENLLKNLPYVSNVHIHGDKRKYIVALITLEKNYVLNYARENNIIVTDFDKLKDHPKVQELVRRGVAEINAQLGSFESIKKFAVLAHDFTVESGELTPSLKVKRKVIDQKYKDLIDSLF